MMIEVRYQNCFTPILTLYLFYVEYFVTIHGRLKMSISQTSYIIRFAKKKSENLGLRGPTIAFSNIYSVLLMLKKRTELRCAFYTISFE